MRPNSIKSRNPDRVHISSSGERPISSAILSSRNLRVSNYLKSQGLQKKGSKTSQYFSTIKLPTKGLSKVQKYTRYY
jgi:hypothetical protein